MAEVIISADTQRPNRLPPGQVRTYHWPVLPEGEVPPFDPNRWDFAVFPAPLVAPLARFTWAEFVALPRVKVFADLHGVAGSSRLDNLWEGVPTRELLRHTSVDPTAKYVMVHSEFGLSTNLPIEDFFAEDALFALRHDGKDLEPNHGYPVRLVVPRLYDWKSAKWVRGIEFMDSDHPGFRERPENGSYHMRGDPWKEERRVV
jgi:DMSO/TMAO reductase YedYZ molybdopterin-dependent catalytic subunit